MIPWLTRSSPPDAFPPVSEALSEPDGLLCAGGDLSRTRLLEAYRRGIFPWFSEGQPILWWSPDPRAVLFPGEFRLTRSLAKEVGSRGVRVNAVAPGYIATEMTSAVPEAARAAFLTQIAMNRAGTPEEVAKVVTFLASDMAAYVSGIVLRVDGCMAI